MFRIPAFLVLALFFGGESHSDGQWLYVFQPFEGEEGVRVMRHEESPSRIASACIHFGVEQLLVFAACQGVHAVVVAFQCGEVDSSQRIQFGTQGFRLFTGEIDEDFQPVHAGADEIP